MNMDSKLAFDRSSVRKPVAENMNFDAEFKEGDHPRAENGQFGSGGTKNKNEMGASLEKKSDFTAERGRFNWQIKDSNGNVVGEYPASLSKKAAIEAHEQKTSAEKQKKESAKQRAKENKPKNEQIKKNLETLNSTMKAKKDVIESAHKHPKLDFHPMTPEQFSGKDTVLIHQSPNYGTKKGSSYRLVMIDGRPAYAREADHWGNFGTADYENGERVEKDYEWNLAGAKTGWGNKERKAGYVFLDDLEKMGNKKQAHDGLAFDRASVRTYDEDGRLHIALTHISKANVCPYKGSEIPDAEEMGLDLDKVYQLLRDPKELEKAAPTFNNLPLLNDHVAVSAYDHKPEMTVGSTGTDAVFNAPYLDNSLVIWAADAIAGIESGEQKELSCAYRYRADMTPGTYEGTPYDGVMRDIRGNHVALVPAGRAGPDVVVGDSQLKEVLPMKPLSRKALLVKGALMAALPGKLATDAKLDLDQLLGNVAADNFRKSKPAILAAIKPKLANDADLAGFHSLLDSMDQPGKSDHDMGKDLEKDKIDGVAEDEHHPVLAFLKGKVSDEDLTKIGEMLAQEEQEEEEEPGAQDETDPLKAASEKQEPAQRALGTEKQDSPAMDKKAMDAAIKLAVKDAEKKAVDRMNKIAAAKEEVRPFVGEVLGMDSAEKVYAYALETLGVDVEGVDPSAYAAVLKAQPKPGQSVRGAFAMDAKATKGFMERFPDAIHIKQVH